MELFSKIKSFFWYLKRPQFLPHLFYQLKLKFLPNKEIFRNEASLWCNNHVSDIETLFIKYEPEISLIKVNNVYNKIFNEAENKANNCPVEMGGPGELDLLYNLVLKNNINNIIETGVAYGWSSMAILLALNEKGSGQLISIDIPYLQRNNDDFVGCIIPENLKNKWKLIRKSDRQALKAAINEFGKIDLCHYDSDKTYYGRMWAYPLLWDALKSGGYFISDDIEDNFAFKDFCEKFSVKPFIIKYQNKYIGIIKKI